MDIYLYAGNYGVRIDTEILEALAFLQILQFLDAENPGLKGIFQVEAGITENCTYKQKMEILVGNRGNTGQVAAGFHTKPAYAGYGEKGKESGSHGGCQHSVGGKGCHKWHREKN